MKYDRHSVITNIEEIFNRIRQAHDNRRQAHDNGHHYEVVNGQTVKICSLRLQTFALKGSLCAKCGMQGLFFALERNHTDKEAGRSFHLNFYGINNNGHDVLFTQDHIKAKCLGGQNTLTNLQTMCSPCNRAKGLGEQQEMINKGQLDQSYHHRWKLQKPTRFD